MRFLIPFVLIAALHAEVRIVAEGGGFKLLRDGKPYFIKGAGGTTAMEKLPPAGANSIRTWSPPAMEVMDTAHKLGLSVLLGLPVGKPRHGFDYSDAKAVEKQRQQTRELVRRYRNHPALLMWALGNESELGCTDAQRLALWKEVEALARIVKEEDKGHPVITVLAGAGRANLKELTEVAGSLDAAGINAYGGMLRLPEAVEAQGWRKAWLVTEFGPRGHWEVDKTPWGLPVEDTSTEKAAFYEKAYRHAVGTRPACLGSYVFLWGQKQEKTHTWYGLFLPDGRAMNPVDAMTLQWTGRNAANRAPVTGRILLEGVKQSGRGWAVAAAGATLRASLDAKDPDGDRVEISWDLRKDVSDNPSTGGDREPSTPPIAGAVQGGTVRMPAEAGNYRLFAYASDGKDRAATANVAIRVE